MVVIISGFFIPDLAKGILFSLHNALSTGMVKVFNTLLVGPLL